MCLALATSIATLWYGSDVRAAVNCSVTSSAVAFGIYNPFNAFALDSTATVSVTCSLTRPETVTVPYTLGLTAGSSASFAVRTMISGPSTLNYNLYADNARSIIWGDGSSGTSVVAGSLGLGHGLGNNGTNTATHTEYARMPAQQDVLPGSYNDSIVVTVTW